MWFKGKRILVAGGAGYIGSYLVRELLERGASVTVADIRPRGKSLEGLLVHYVLADLRERSACLRVCEDVDGVANLAAQVGGIGESSRSHGSMLTENTQIGFNLLQAAHLYGVPRFLLVSSSCVYPDDMCVPREIAGGTGVPESANQGYGWAKRMLELQVNYYRKEYGIEASIVRLSNVVGGAFFNRTQVIPMLLRRALEGDDPLVVWGSGTQSRNFIPVREVAKAMAEIFEGMPPVNAVNIGSETKIEICALASLILKVVGRPEGGIHCDKSKPEGAHQKSVSSELLRQVLPPDLISRLPGLFGPPEQANQVLEDSLREAKEFVEAHP